MHLRFAVLEALALGILANAPVVALRSLGSPPWQLALALVPSGLGIVVDLYVGARMAPRSKIPYVQSATLVFAVALAGMSFVASPLLFNALHGLGLLGQVVARMALTPVLREAYPAVSRGAVTGRIRRWVSLSFFVSALLSALFMERLVGSPHELLGARILIGIGAALAVAATWRVRRMPVLGDAPDRSAAGPAEGGRALRHTCRILRDDRRFRLYVVAALVAAIGSLTTAAYVNSFLARNLNLGYLSTLTVAQLVPNAVAFLTTERWGRFIDRHNGWSAWIRIRAVWGTSFVVLALAAWVGPAAPSAAIALTVVSKVAFGAVMGGSWILYWQVGVTQFAPLGSDTSRYMSILAMASGLGRMVGPSVGATLLLTTGSVGGVFALGGLLTFVAVGLCAVGFRRDAGQARYRNPQEFESSQLPSREGPR